jgi:hypothetical protein
MKKGAVPLIKTKRSSEMLDFTGENGEEYWFDHMYLKLSEVAKRHDLSVSIPTQNGIHQFADFIIVLDDHNMLGLTLNPELSVKPFKIFPEGAEIGLDEIDDFLDGFEVARNNL